MNLFTKVFIIIINQMNWMPTIVTVVAGQKTDNIDFNFAKIDTGIIMVL